MNLKLDMDIQQTARNCAEQFSILSPGEKCESKNGIVEILSFSSVKHFVVRFTLLPRARETRQLRAARNAFRRCNVRQQSRSFDRWNRSPRPKLQPALLRFSAIFPLLYAHLKCGEHILESRTSRVTGNLFTL